MTGFIRRLRSPSPGPAAPACLGRQSKGKGGVLGQGVKPKNLHNLPAPNASTRADRFLALPMKTVGPKIFSRVCMQTVLKAVE